MFPSNPRNYPEVDVPGQAPCIQSNVPVFLSPWSLASSSLWPMLGPPTYTYTYHFRPSEIAVPHCSSEPKIPELPKWNGRKVFLPFHFGQSWGCSREPFSGPQTTKRVSWSCWGTGAACCMPPRHPGPGRNVDMLMFSASSTACSKDLVASKDDCPRKTLL